VPLTAHTYINTHTIPLLETPLAPAFCVCMGTCEVKDRLLAVHLTGAVLDQELIHIASLFHYLPSCSCCFVGATLFKKPIGPRRFKSDRAEIYQDCSSKKYAVGIFDMTSYFQDGGHDVHPPFAAAQSKNIKLTN